MNISEMHVWFRQYAQQMGLQNTRAILPEQIDLVINTSIHDVVNEIINGSVAGNNDRIITDNSKLPAINSLRTLYRVIEGAWLDADAFELDVDSEHPLALATIGNNPLSFNASVNTDLQNALFYVDFALNYGDRDAEGEEDEGKTRSSETKYTTRWFPIRVIDDMYLADVLNDWILAPRFRSPVMTVHGDIVTIDNNSVPTTKFTVYLGENDLPAVKYRWLGKVRCGYIKKPNKVRYVSDINSDDSNNVNCDLPEHLHIPILKHAVDLYRVAISGSLYANQQQEQQQSRENARNNARPNNEGYQS